MLPPANQAKPGTNVKAAVVLLAPLRLASR
jgi:hypothetical protein